MGFGWVKADRCFLIKGYLSLDTNHLADVPSYAVVSMKKGWRWRKWVVRALPLLDELVSKLSVNTFMKASGHGGEKRLKFNQ